MVPVCRRYFKLFGMITMMSLCIAPMTWFIKISFGSYSPIILSSTTTMINNNPIRNTTNLPSISSSNKSKIDLSFIITSRNDNYGENPILRLRFTLQNLMLYQWSSHQISIEIIIIEWNTINSKQHLWEFPLIRQLIKMYKDKFKINENNYKEILYFYSIPSDYNDRLNCNDNEYCPFYEYHAKNLGLRRSKGIWKLVMNIDDLWSHNLLNFVASSISYNLLDKNGLYQAKRGIVELNRNQDKYIMDYVNKSEIIRTRYRNFYAKTVNYTEMYEGCLVPYKKLNITMGREGVVQGPGDFLLFHGDILYKYFIGGFVESCHNVHLDTEFVMRQININKLNAYYIDKNCSYFHIQHSKERLMNKTEIDEDDRNLYKNKTFNCNQTGRKIKKLWPTEIDLNKELPLNGTDTFWRTVYLKTNQNWGLKDETFFVSKVF